MFMDHDAGRMALVELAGILDSLHVPHFLIQGTALGAYRDKGFVPTERDIDIGVLQEHLQPSFGAIAHILCDRGYEIESWALPFQHCRTLVVRMHDVKADIVGMMQWQNKRFTACPVHHTIPKPYAIVHSAEMLETYQTVELFGRTFNIPSPIEQYLEREYGTGWRTPQDDHISRTRIYNFLQDNGINDANLCS